MIVSTNLQMISMTRCVASFHATPDLHPGVECHALSGNAMQFLVTFRWMSRKKSVFKIWTILSLFFLVHDNPVDFLRILTYLDLTFNEDGLESSWVGHALSLNFIYDKIPLRFIFLKFLSSICFTIQNLLLSLEIKLKSKRE